MHRSRLALAALAASLLTGCASDSDDAPAPGASAPSSSPQDDTQASPPDDVSRPAAARRALRRAIETMRQDDATGFEVVADYGSLVDMATSGVTTTSGWTATMTMTDPNEPEPAVMESRSTDGTVWMQMRDWPAPMTGCWLEMGPGQVPVGIQAMQPDEPTYFSLLVHLRTSGYANEAATLMDGDLGATAALSLLPSQLLGELNLTSLSGDERVPVEIGVDDARVTHVTMAGSDLLQLLADAGAKADGTTAATIGVLETTVSYTLPDDVPDVLEPSADLVVTSESDPDAGCRSD